MRSKIPILLLMFLSSQAAGAALHPVGPAFRANSFKPGLQTSPEVAVAPDGKFLVVWSDRSARSSGFDVFARLFGPDGAPLGPELRVNGRVSGFQGADDVAVDSRGGFIVVWTGELPGERTNIFGRRLSAEGRPLGRELRISQPGSTDQSSARIATGPDGSFAVAWDVEEDELTEAEDATFFASDVHARRFAPNGTPLGSQFQVNERTFDDQFVGGLGIGPAGELFVVWDSWTGENFYQADLRRFAPEGTAGPELQVNSEELDWGRQYQSTLAMAPDGTFLVAWTDWALDGIVVRRFGPDGAPLGEERRVNDVKEGEFFNFDIHFELPDLTALPGGGFVLVWTDSAGLKGIFGQLLTSEGAPVGEVFRVAPVDPGFLGGGRVAAGGGTVVAAWGSRINLRGKIRDVDVFARLLAPDVLPPEATALRLQEDRFHLEFSWTDRAGARRQAGAVRVSADTGYFWFSDPANPELLVKVLDASALDGHYWVFFTYLTDVAWTLSVSDSVLARSRLYHHPPGRLGGGQADLTTFAIASPSNFEGSEPATVVGGTAPGPPGQVAPCDPAGARLCLAGGRFEVEVSWRAPQGASGTGRAVPVSSDAGAFWFFDPANLELMVKIVDGRALNGHFWVFFGSLSSLEATIRIRDRETGAVQTYTNPAGSLSSFADTAAF